MYNKGKVLLRTDHEGREGAKTYRCTLPSTSGLYGGWVVNATPRPLYPRERSGTHCLGGWEDPRGRSGRVQKISPPTVIRSSDCPARSESLYRLSYPGPTYVCVVLLIVVVCAFKLYICQHERYIF